MRRPLVVLGFRLSKGMVFLLTIIPEASKWSAAWRPLKFFVFGSEVYQHQMIIGATTHQAGTHFRLTVQRVPWHF